MKVLDYEGVNGDQDKDELDVELRSRVPIGNVKQNRSRFDKTQPTSDMRRGTHIGQPAIGQAAIINENRSSNEMAIAPNRNHSLIINDLSVVAGERGDLTTAEKMV